MSSPILRLFNHGQALGDVPISLEQYNAFAPLLRMAETQPALRATIDGMLRQQLAEQIAARSADVDPASLDISFKLYENDEAAAADA